MVTNSLIDLDTPGLATGVAVHQGLALVTDGDLRVYNILPADTAGRPPQVSLNAGFSLNPPRAESGQPTWLEALATDDVQIRNVEYYIDRERLGLDGSFPFEYGFRAPTPAATKTSLTVRVRARDTAGASVWSDEVQVALVDTTPPTSFDPQPVGGSVLPSGTLSRLSVSWTEPLASETLNTASFRLVEAGLDGSAGTADDVPVTGQVHYDAASMVGSFETPIALNKGFYTAILTTQIADPDGNRRRDEFRWSFEVRDPNRWIAAGGGSRATAANWSGGAVRELDVIVIDLPGTNLTTQITSGNWSLLRLFTEENFTLSGGALNIETDAALRANFNLSGGRLTLLGQAVVNGLLPWSTVPFRAGAQPSPEAAS